MDILQEHIDDWVHQKFLQFCSMQQKLQYTFVYSQEEGWLDLQYEEKQLMMKVNLQKDLY